MRHRSVGRNNNGKFGDTIPAKRGRPDWVPYEVDNVLEHYYAEQHLAGKDGKMTDPTAGTHHGVYR